MPFGLTARQMDAWMMEGEGLRLTRELFKPLKAVNFRWAIPAARWAAGSGRRSSAWAT